MRRWIWLGLLVSTSTWAQDTLTFDSVDIEGDRKKAAWTALGARPAWSMPTPIALPTGFAAHRVDLLPPMKPVRDDSPPARVGGRNAR